MASLGRFSCPLAHRQSHFVGFLASNAASGRKNSIYVRSVQSGELGCNDRSWLEAELHEIRGKARFRANHAKVRQDCQPKAAANGCACTAATTGMLVSNSWTAAA